ncbi:MAG TPA: class II aldolase/adducin family protein [Bryobacteraceae bacterium]|jgi:HCOMODA/2-hydroxy-3-carboxy-muconic semialdehyde decarboxylase|nr:class II aldolase/adducin family protein [Bryobacteraceae bacterium]
MQQDRRDFIRSIALAAAGGAVLRGQTAANPIGDLVAANRILASHQIFDAYGHVSMRSEANPQRYFMARSVAAELVTAADILEYDLDSKVVGGPSPTPAVFLERFIHGEIYKAREDVKAVVHCHTPSLIPFGTTGVPLRAMFGLAGFLADGVPVFDIRKEFGATDLLVRDPARGAALARALGNKPVAMMRGHGAAVVAASLPVVVGRCIYLDMNAQVEQRAMALGGKITFLTPAEGKQSVADDYRRAWELWRREIAAAER